MQEITSSQNPRIKELVRLSSQKKERSLSGLFVVESAKLVEEAALAGIGIEALYRTDEAAEKYAPYLAPAIFMILFNMQIPLFFESII